MRFLFVLLLGVFLFSCSGHPSVYKEDRLYFTLYDLNMNVSSNIKKDKKELAKIKDIVTNSKLCPFAEDYSHLPNDNSTYCSIEYNPDEYIAPEIRQSILFYLKYDRSHKREFMKIAEEVKERIENKTKYSVSTKRCFEYDKYSYQKSEGEYLGKYQECNN